MPYNPISIENDISDDTSDDISNNDTIHKGDSIYNISSMLKELTVEGKKYNPIFNFFDINYKSNVSEYKEQTSYNNYTIITTDNKQVSCFIKSIPLVDYIKYLIGKYKKFNINVLPSKSTIYKNIYEEYINSIHNYSYVDNFFYILSNNININGFKHGLNVYDSYICFKNDCEINIVDDFEYLCDSNYFNDNINKLFHFKDSNIHSLLSNFKKPPIILTDEYIDITFDVIEDEYPETSTKSYDISSDEPIDIIHESKKTLEINNTVEDESEDESSDESDESSESENETDDESEDESKDGSNSTSEYSDSEDSMVEELILVINQIPTQNIVMEKCIDTLDSLFELNNIKVEELTSALFQTIIMLYVYQQVYQFTHNDLHTNNIMYIETKEEFLYYKVKGQCYKVPTYGKLYKMIDFGRSIYTYKGTRLCSDSFSSNGTAHGQYNCEPFLNKDKPIIEPNYSFDLCRLSCSLFDFIIEDLDDIDKFRKVPVYDMIISWIFDDSGNNILYKKNGDERYPDFKLYKMISKNVTKHTPENQFSRDCFKEYIVSELPADGVDIDELIKTKGHL